MSKRPLAATQANPQDHIVITGYSCGANAALATADRAALGLNIHPGLYRWPALKHRKRK